MANIWKAQSKVNNKIKRNNHDLSKKSNISLKFGTLYPVYCKKVFPGDSFSIDTAFNLKLQPVIFPVQTKMRAHMHYFYVRNKNLWSGWEDWITGLRTNEETPHPYLNVRDSDIKTSSIHDFLGVPTSLVSQSTILSQFATSFEETVVPAYTPYFYTYDEFVSLIANHTQLATQTFTANDLVPFSILSFSDGSSDFRNYFKRENRIKSISGLEGYYSSFGTATLDNPYLFFYYNDVVRKYPVAIVQLLNDDDGNIFFNLTDEQLSAINGCVKPVWCCVAKQFSSFLSTEEIPPVSPIVFNYELVSQGVAEYSDLSIPLFSRELRLNALPYRAYESIYNAFYRNTQVDPLIINGRTEYNKFVEYMGDGADNFNYHLHQRNYELDFLTSALPSPQQGVAPLVGMTALGDITIEDENGITTAKATVDDDGTITDVVVTSPAASIEHQRVAMSLAQFGMNIQDFRNANAYLRLLETSIRKGYRYIENILGHWGVAPKHNTLDMPEFIGGFSRDVQVSTVVSSADTLGSDGLSLGDYGGYAQLVGGSKSPVRHFCDDHGFIIGILSVVPTPCYSQLLPKQMIAPTSYLDYYFPEFDQIGYQPITYKEVAPIQSYLDSLTDPNKRLEDTFGYQRPNYDLVGDVDEVHGLFRTDFRNYVINRIFDTRPELGHDFISINPSEINQIFVDTNPDDDCIIGEIGFAVHTKRPVSRVVIPGLGH